MNAQIPAACGTLPFHRKDMKLQVDTMARCHISMLIL